MTQTTYRKGTPVRRELLLMLAFGLLVAAIPCGCGDDGGGKQVPAPPNNRQVQPLRNDKQVQGPRNTAETIAEQAKAVAEIRTAGGKITIDEENPDKPVATINLTSAEFTDAGLEHLKGLTQLQSLNLMSTKVTDAGLEHLKGLTQLRSLDLGNTKVTDAGLEHLKGLTQLQTLDLGNTKVTDAGLEHLKGLTQLQSLDLGNTEVTDAGLEHLKGLTQLRSLDLRQHQGHRRRARAPQGADAVAGP